MPKRLIKKSFKAVLIILVFLVAISAGGYCFLNFYYLPRKGKAMVAEQMEEALDREVRIGTLKWGIRSGLVVSDIQVYNKAGDETFLKADSVVLRYRISSLLKKKFIISSIHAKGPLVLLNRNSEGEWNFEDLLEKRQEEARIEFNRILLSDAIVSMSDETGKLDGVEISDISLLLWQEGSRYRFFFSGTSSVDGGPVALSGVTATDDKPPEIQFKSNNLHINSYLGRFLPQSPLVVNEDPVDIKIDLRMTGGRWRARVRMHSDRFFIKAREDQWYYRGGIAATASVGFDPKHLEAIEYESTISALGGDFYLRSLDRKFSNCSGRLDLVNDRLSSEKMHGQWQGVTGTVAFVIEDFTGGTLALKGNVTGPTAELIDFSDTVANALKGLSFAGEGGGDIAVSGPLDTGTVDIGIEAWIEDNRIDYTYLDLPIVNADATISVFNNDIYISQLSGQYNAADFKNVAEIHISGDTIAVDFDFIADNLDVALSGIFKNIDPTFYDLDITINGDVERLLRFMPHAASRPFVDADVRGNISNRISIRGNFIDPTIIEASGDMVGQNLVVQNVPIDDLTASIRLSEGTFNLEEAVLRVLDGSGTVSVGIDFSDTPADYNITVVLNGIDISPLPELLANADQDIKGLLSVDAVINGQVGDRRTIQGKGDLRIRDANLWEIKVFDLFFQLIKVRIPVIGRVVFNKVRCTFELIDDAVITRDLHFSSPTLDMTTIGKLGFNGDLLFDIDAKFFRSKGNIITVPIKFLLNLPARVIPRIYLRGTVHDPKFRWHPLPRIPIIDDIFRRKPV